ncbi:MAG: hypothetical protein Q8918_12625 [Bacteroidota bacterium]|nr:hypothetical protein [Bacteroidota bacterium]MDP4211846.1 hypothetical protein [Bacteroidota bacterium]MDP4250946.1 hypothetical protein [Bacteroidota bacterium]
MSITRAILIKSLVKTFYRQNTGLLAFLLFMTLGVVGRANNAGLLEYHYAMIRGMMINPGFLILIMFAWFIYAKKCEQFISHTLQRPEFSFLHILSVIDGGKIFGLLLLAQVLIYLPILWYVLLIAGVGIHQHWYIQVVVVLLYNLSLCVISAFWYLFLLRNTGTSHFAVRWRIPSLVRDRFYWTFFSRYIIAKRKVLFTAIKIYSCCILYLMVSRQLQTEYDLSMIILFYSFGLLGHSVIIHQFRELEETRLTFYRGMAVSLFGRFIQYGSLYFVLFIPEMITISLLTPGYLHYNDAFLFVFLGYTLLLLMNGILFIKSFRRMDYLKIIVAIFFIIFISVLTGTVFWLTLLCFILSVYLFFSRYYLYERS